jgi:hypothetical protein
MDRSPIDERRHPGAAVEEWVFTCWTPDASVGAISGHRLLGSRAWYWTALVRAGAPLLHAAEWDVVLRADPMIVKADSLWAEHVCDEPFAQWSVGNETYAVELDDPEDALGRAYGDRRPIAFDLEWYATGPPRPWPAGYEQSGVVHGRVDLGTGPGALAEIELAEVPARRWHRWGDRLGPVELEDAYAHTGLRAPFAFPDSTLADWVLTPDGWRSRVPSRSPPPRSAPNRSPGRAVGGAPGGRRARRAGGRGPGR